MELLVQPMPVAEAVDRVAGRAPVTAALRSAEWADVPLALRDQAFFSSGVEWADFLETGRDKLLKTISLRKEQVARGAANVDRSSFIGDMRRLVIGAGKGTGTDPNDLTDLASRARLGLIYDMQTQSATNHARWKFEQRPAVLNAFPAQELLPSAARSPRADWEEKWTAAGGRLFNGRMIALKTDPVWSAISRFGVPWPPFDYGSKRQLRDIDRAEAEALGLLQPEDELTGGEAELNERMQASVENLSRDAIARLKAIFGSQVNISDGKATWQGRAA